MTLQQWLCGQRWWHESGHQWVYSRSARNKRVLCCMDCMAERPLWFDDAPPKVEIVKKPLDVATE